MVAPRAHPAPPSQRRVDPTARGPQCVMPFDRRVPLRLHSINSEYRSELQRSIETTARRVPTSPSPPHILSDSRLDTPRFDPSPNPRLAQVAGLGFGLPPPPHASPSKTLLRESCGAIARGCRRREDHPHSQRAARLTEPALTLDRPRACRKIVNSSDASPHRSTGSDFRVGRSPLTLQRNNVVLLQLPRDAHHFTALIFDLLDTKRRKILHFETHHFRLTLTHVR